MSLRGQSRTPNDGFGDLVARGPSRWAQDTGPVRGKSPTDPVRGKSPTGITHHRGLLRRGDRPTT